MSYGKKETMKERRKGKGKYLKEREIVQNFVPASGCFATNTPSA
jgi:hypothetical protein